MAEYIDRQVVVDALKQLPHEYRNKEQRARTGGIAACQVIVKDVPAADVRPVVRANWVYDCERMAGDGWTYRQHHCTNCGFQSIACSHYNYCPNCGADMRGFEDAEI